MRYLIAYTIAAFVAASLAGCASISTTATAPDGWTIKQNASAVGKAGIDKVSQGLDGSVKLEDPEGQSVEVNLNSTASGENLHSENDLNLLGAQVFGFILELAKKGAGTP